MDLPASLQEAFFVPKRSTVIVLLVAVTAVAAAAGVFAYTRSKRPGPAPLPVEVSSGAPTQTAGVDNGEVTSSATVLASAPIEPHPAPTPHSPPASSVSDADARAARSILVAFIEAKTKPDRAAMERYATSGFIARWSEGDRRELISGYGIGSATADGAALRFAVTYHVVAELRSDGSRDDSRKDLTEHFTLTHAPGGWRVSAGDTGSFIKTP